MGDVFKFKKPDVPHLAGEAECGRCGHRWQAVAPVGTVHLDCPKCDTVWGLCRHAIEPTVGQSAWRCNCGEQLFWIMPHGCMCRQCEAMQKVS